MGQGKIRRRRYLVLPAQGVASPAMESGLFKGSSAEFLSEAVRRGVGNYRGFDGSVAAASRAVISSDDFTVLSQRFADGPAVVSMSPEGWLALEAGYPGLRVLPITKYFLPGHRPTRAKSAAAAARVAGIDAGSGGTVFNTDVKTHFLGAISGGGDGAGVTVGVVDTGVDSTHPSLRRCVAALRCTVPGEAPAAGGPVDWGPTAMDRAGHGTHVAGIIAGDRGVAGPSGVAPDAKIVSYRVFPNNKSGVKGAENPSIIDAIRAAVEDGCHVINLSIEGSGLKDDGVRSAISNAWSQGVVCVAAAGNGFGNPVSYPAALPHCVAVTAIGRDGAFPSGSQFA